MQICGKELKDIYTFYMALFVLRGKMCESNLSDFTIKYNANCVTSLLAYIFADFLYIGSFANLPSAPCDEKNHLNS